MKTLDFKLKFDSIYFNGMQNKVQNAVKMFSKYG